MRRVAVALAVAAGVACGNLIGPGSPGPGRITGIWSGDGARLAAADAGAQLEYPCFIVEMTRPLDFDDSRAFNVLGQRAHVGGAYLPDVPPESQGVTLEGAVSGRAPRRVLQIVVRPIVRNGPPTWADTFALREGRHAMVLGCP